MSVKLIAIYIFMTHLVFLKRAAAICSDGDIRLVDGANEYEGRVEVCLNDQWGTVCDDFWKSNPNNARVACRQLGYSDEGAQTRASDPNRFLPPPFGLGSGPIFWDDIQCTGTEQRLDNCPHLTTPGGSTDCIHDEDVGVTCQPPVIVPDEATTTSESVLSAVTTSTLLTQPIEVSDNRVGSEVAVTTLDPQITVVKTTTVQSKTTMYTGPLGEHNHTPFNLPIDVTSLIKSNIPETIVITVVVAVILLGLISASILLLTCILIRRTRHREKGRDIDEADFVDENPNTPTNYEPHQTAKDLAVFISYCAIPGNGKLAENVCYDWTTFQREGRPQTQLHHPTPPIEAQPTVLNIAYESVSSGTRNNTEDGVHHYETISGITAVRGDYYNTRLGATT